MSLDPAYLEYPRRRKGYDHDLYAWSPLRERPPVQWPGGKALAVWPVVSLEWFPITPSDKPFRASGHMQTAYPIIATTPRASTVCALEPIVFWTLSRRWA
jgi:hypothetical protein